MALNAMDVWCASYRVKPGPIRGPGQPLSGAERMALMRLRRAGKVPPYPWIARDLAANGHRTATGCLEWTRARSDGGYGHIKRDGRMVAIHRLALEAALGRPLQPGMVARHTCDNPPCFAAEHLIEGTLAENTADMFGRGRGQLPPRARR